MDPKELGEKIDKLEAALAANAEKVEGASDEDVKAIQADVQKISDELKPLLDERERVLREEEVKSLKAQVTTLEDAFKELRKPGFEFAEGDRTVEDAKASDGPYGPDSPYSFYQDILSANKGNTKAIERLQDGLGQEDVKAMTEGTDSAGGYLVPPQVSSELIRLREDLSRLRPRFSSIQVNSDTLQIGTVTGGLTAGWVAELAVKPSADMTFGQITASVFTAAGLAIASNQLIQDARPSIDGLINRELAQRLVAVEETAFIEGTGTGQPRGILNTTGVNSITLSTWGIDAFLDSILDAIAAVQNDFFGDPNAIVMHPRRWQKALKFRNADTKDVLVSQRDVTDPTSPGSIYGIPVVLSRYIPTDLGTGTDEDRIIVGKLDEALVLDRSGIVADRSEHVHFTTNQTVFRAEERLGFTAARYPDAFSVISGAGLVP